MQRFAILSRKLIYTLPLYNAPVGPKILLLLRDT